MATNSLKSSSHQLEKTDDEVNIFGLLRSEIDNIDTQLLDLLGKRMRCAQAIGTYKKKQFACFAS